MKATLFGMLLAGLLWLANDYLNLRKDYVDLRKTASWLSEVVASDEKQSYTRAQFIDFLIAKEVRKSQ